MNKYFDNTLPQNNKLWNYSWDYTKKHETTASFLAHLTPIDFYRVIPFAFNQSQTGYDSDFQHKLKQFIARKLSDKNNISYLATRCKYSKKYLSRSSTEVQYPNNRNNVLHGLIATNPANVSVSDIALMKEIFKLAIEAGVHPLEKSMSSGLTPLALFITNSHMNPFTSEQDLDFVQFMIDFHPDSLTNFSENKEPILALPIYILKTSSSKKTANLIKFLAQNLPEQVIQQNLEVVKEFCTAYARNNPQSSRKPLSETLDILKVRAEKISLSKNLKLVLPTTDYKILENPKTKKQIQKI